MPANRQMKINCLPNVLPMLTWWCPAVLTCFVEWYYDCPPPRTGNINTDSKCATTRGQCQVMGRTIKVVIRLTMFISLHWLSHKTTPNSTMQVSLYWRSCNMDFYYFDCLDLWSTFFLNFQHTHFHKLVDYLCKLPKFTLGLFGR